MLYSVYNTMSTEEIIIKNFETLKLQTNKLPQADKLIPFLDKNAERIMLAPASTKLEFVCAYPGGLVENSLRVLSLFAKTRTAYGVVEQLPGSSLILTSLFHDIGKIGTATDQYYLDEDSSWHREKLGQMYKINEKLQYISPGQLSLIHLTSNGVQLTVEEWYAISSIRENNKDEVPKNSEPLLSLLLHQSIKMALFLGKNKQEVSSIS